MTSSTISAAVQRPKAAGKFLYLGNEKLWVRGVTYGTFRPSTDGNEFHKRKGVEQDFAQISANGLNAVRTYTVPPPWFLDAAQRHGLRVMVGLPWEQHVAFLDDSKRAQAIEERVRADVRACAGHPGILCYAIGNEIPAPIVRWHGCRQVERYIERLYRAAKAEDPEGLVTYVNYPSTEYLQLPFIDVVCFNVYLESQDRLEAYLAHLHNIVGHRPLIMAEVGLDSHRHGEDGQAYGLEWQVRTTFAAGCAGLFVFSWTNEWHRGGYDIEDWEFGLTTRDRRPKPALGAVRDAVADVPFPKDTDWPRISVVVCSYNGARTIRDSFEGLLKLRYPNFEVIVINDGSSDKTGAIAKEYGFRLIDTENRGLGSARNTGLKAATGEIVAYIDDDAYPDPDWLSYLALVFLSSPHVGVGGPNISPAGDGPIADCVANAPGGPVHVLLSDREAEHIPGCNMAFRKAALETIGEFDPQFRTAGDDVDVCWRLLERGWTLGYSPAAVVWHHRRNSVGAYWEQQQGYGKAEALLEKKWPEKYNGAGHLNWAGRVYTKGLTQTIGWRRGRVYHGLWGSALFQSVYQPAPSLLWSLPQMPEWYLVIVALALLSALGALWGPLLLALPLLGVAIVFPVVQACASAAQASFSNAPPSRLTRLWLRTVTALLHLLQPLARLRGRLSYGLTPWRRRGLPGRSLPWWRTSTIWSERWQATTERIRSFEAALRAHCTVVLRGGEYDRWDLEVWGGMLGAVRLRVAVEEHGAGRQLVRFRSWPRCSPGGLALTLLFSALSAGAALDHAWVASVILVAPAALLAVSMVHECVTATGAFLRALRATEQGTVGT
ncbi:MAG TPA: glycosyltransferase [Candidatus Tectomicrobia bacterium]